MQEQQRTAAQSNGLLVGVDDKISVGKAFLLGLQHVLAMDLYIAPIIIASLLGLSGGDTSFFIQMCFLATGIGTLIQTGIFMRLPVVQGPSYIPIGAMAAIGSKLGLAAMTGSLLPGALLISILGWPLKWFAKVVRKVIPPIVGGTVIMVVGVTLIPSAMNSIFTAPGNLGDNVVVAGASAAVLVICMLFGSKLKRGGTLFRLLSVILAIIVGTIVASIYGKVDLSPVKGADWFKLPELFPFGKPTFDLSAVITMAIVYLIVLIETTGTWFVVSSVTGSELTEKRLNRGALGEGLGCFVGSAFGGSPMTGYSSNAGLIAVTGVGSRMAIMAGGVILLALGFMPKLSVLITCIPDAVINGIFAIVCVAILMNGMKVIQPLKIDDRNMMIVGIPIALTLGLTVFPKDVLNTLPDIVNYILSSGTAVGAIAALVLNLIIPKGKEEKSED
ncbi:uracil-xanthine permease family protein [Cohnella sp. AR92]|uniref:uracil-xanthine permease family protein n=1 Tax=Cohnella sp. AR92 TaxID=648716 RepID=UPI000F8D2684|nr:nucleobase:cation symporter-2 family protein [Cohnella sp. AR92]RUS49136.1 purine permease [Cohnella sp. AR92]